MQAADGSSTAPLMDASPALNLVTGVGGQVNSAGAGQVPRKRGRPPTKNRQSLPSAINNGDSPLYLGANNNNNNNNNSTPAIQSSNHFSNTNGSANNVANGAVDPAMDKTKRVRRADDYQLTIPFEFGWSRIVRFRWQPPGPQIVAEVTYKSPSGRIFRSYAKINEFLTAEQTNAMMQSDLGMPQVSVLRPENFSFSSRARIPGTTFQKTVMTSQGFKEYREMSAEEVELLFSTMTETSRNKMSNPTPIYEQIFGAYQPTAVADGGDNGVQDFSMKSAGARSDAVNLSVSAAVRPPQHQATHQVTMNGDDKKYPHSTLTNSNIAGTAGGLDGAANLSATSGGSSDEQQAMLMFMTALFMQQQQQQTHLGLFPPRSVPTMPGLNNLFPNNQTPSQPPRQQNPSSSSSNNENLSMMTGVAVKKTTSSNMPELGHANLATIAERQTAVAAEIANRVKSENELRSSTAALAPVLLAPLAPAPPTLIPAPIVPAAVDEVKKPPQISSVDREILRMQKQKKRQQERRLKLAELKQELNRQPADDMALIQRRPLPDLPRFATYSLLVNDNQAIADCFQIFEFVQTFAGVLGLDVKGLPSLACLERGIAAADRQSLLEVTDLLCRLVAIGLQDAGGWLEGAVSELVTTLQTEQEGAAAPTHHRGQQHHPRVVVEIDDDTELWQQLPKLPIDRTTVTEASRHFLAVRNSGRQTDETRLLNEAFFQTMKPRQRARILAAVCDELLAYSSVLNEIERCLLKSVELKRDLLNVQGRLKVLQQPTQPAKSCDSAAVADNFNASPAKKQLVEGDAVETGETGEGVVPAADGDAEPVLVNEPATDDQMEEATDDVKDLEAEKSAEIKKLTRQEKTCRSRLTETLNSIRSLHLGFDRFGRSFWSLPHIGALLVHGSDFSEIKPVVQQVEHQIDEKPCLEENMDEESSPADVVAETMDVDAKQQSFETASPVKTEHQPEVPEPEIESESEQKPEPEPEPENDPEHEPEPEPERMATEEVALTSENDQKRDEDEDGDDENEEGDEIEQVRWSPPPNYLASQQQPQQPVDASQQNQQQQQQQQQQRIAGGAINMAASNSPKLPRRKGPARPRKSQNADNNAAMDLSCPIAPPNQVNQAQAPYQSQQTAAINGQNYAATDVNQFPNGGVTVTVDPAVLLQQFLMLAKSLNMTGMGMGGGQQMNAPLPFQAPPSVQRSNLEAPAPMTIAAPQAPPSVDVECTPSNFINNLATEKIGVNSPRRSCQPSDEPKDISTHHRSHNLHVHFEDECTPAAVAELPQIEEPPAVAQEQPPPPVNTIEEEIAQPPSTPVQEKPVEIAIEPQSSPSETEESPTTLANRELLHDKALPVPDEMARGWWRVTDVEQINGLMRSLNQLGVRERHLFRNLQRSLPRLEKMLTESTVDVATHGDFFKVEPSTDENELPKCDTIALGAEIESETFNEIVTVAKFVLTPNQKLVQAPPPYQGRGRPRKSQSTAPTTVTVKDMPPVSDYNEEDDVCSEDKENGKMQRARKLLLDVAYSLAGRKMLQPPFAVVPIADSQTDASGEVNEAATVYELSNAFSRFITGVNKATTWSAIKLRLAQLESMSNVRLHPGDMAVQHTSPKKQQQTTNNKRDSDEVESVASLCRQLLESLKEHPDAEPFLYPVSRIDYPSYFEVIDTPMDFQTIDNKLHQNCYRTLADFATDVRLIFSNCHQYNADGSEFYEQATRLKRWFERRLRQLAA